MPKYKVSEEVAEEQLETFLDFYDIDIASIDHKEVQAGLKLSASKVKRAIRKGKLSVELAGDSIKVIQTFKNTEGTEDTIDYTVIAGRHKVAMKDKSDTDNYGKIYALMGSLSGLGEKAILKLKGADLGLVESLGGLYLQV